MAQVQMEYCNRNYATSNALSAIVAGQKMLEADEDALDNAGDGSGAAGRVSCFNARCDMTLAESA